MYGIVRSPWGRAFKALRENPIRAESLGVDTRRLTLIAFAIGSAYGGLAGALVSPLVQFIEPGSFALVHSLRILLMVVVGGSGFFFGPLLGAAVVILLPEVLRFTEGYYLMIYAALVIVLMAFCPSGLMGVWGQLRDRFQRKTIARADMQAGRAALSRRSPSSRSAIFRRRSARSGRSTASASMFYPGEILGLIGPNGSGKSTLFNCILGQLKPDRGRVEVNGRSVSGRRALRSQQARRRPHLPAALGLSQDDGARQHHRRGAGASRHHAQPPVRRPRCRPDAPKPTS